RRRRRPVVAAASRRASRDATVPPARGHDLPPVLRALSAVATSARVDAGPPLALLDRMPHVHRSRPLEPSARRPPTLSPMAPGGTRGGGGQPVRRGGPRRLRALLQCLARARTRLRLRRAAAHRPRLRQQRGRPVALRPRARPVPMPGRRAVPPPPPPP